MQNAIKNKLTLENLMCLFICICPILDVISFLYRNYFETTLSPSTILRPIMPCICFIVLFFKEKNKKQKIMITIIYSIYSIIHILLFQKLHNQSSYGNIVSEFQYIINYSFLIINIYLFYKLIKDKTKIINAVFFSLSVYVAILFISIITNTSSPTYIEGIGYKGYFESGNSLCTVLILSICIILATINIKQWKKILLTIFTGIYLCLFSGMRTGLFGFSIILGVFIFSKFLLAIKHNTKVSKRQVITITCGIILALILIFIFGSQTLERRKLLKENEVNNVDLETMDKRYVTGDILNLYKQIKAGLITKEYMSNEEKNAIIDLCEFAKKIELSNVNLRAQQLIYNVFLVKEQKNIGLILFGNGYKNQTGELVLEMEVFGLILNFGIIGFILYYGPIIAMFFIGLYKGIKNRNRIDIEYIMYLTGAFIAIMLSGLSGYVYFNFSSMTIAIVLNILLIRKSFDLQT